MVRGATNTFGLGDPNSAGMSNLTGVGGGDLAQQRATSAARAQADPLYGVGEAAGYLPMGAEGIASRLGGGVLGMAGEGAAAGALGDVGNEKDYSLGSAGMNALAGAGVGAATGGTLGALSKAFTGGGPASSAIAQQRADITDAAKTAKESAFAALKAPKYDQGELLDQLDQAKGDLYAGDPDGTLPRAAPQAMKSFNNLYGRRRTPLSRRRARASSTTRSGAWMEFKAMARARKTRLPSTFRTGSPASSKISIRLQITAPPTCRG